MIVLQIGHLVDDIGFCVVVIIDGEHWVVVIHMDAVGGGGLKSDGRCHVVFDTQFHADAFLFDVGHDEVDELALVGIASLGATDEHVLTIEATVPDEVLVCGVVTCQTHFEDGRAVEVAQVECADAFAFEVVRHEGMAGTGRDVDVAELRGLQHIGCISHDMITPVDGVCDTGFDARIEEVMLDIVAV